jgi:CheY-like chemotaxis protein
VYVPAAVETPPETSLPVSATPLGQGELILLVDDEASVRAVIQRVLEANRYRVIASANGEEALQRLVEYREAVQLVLTDLMMPVMDGVQFVRALRVLEPTLAVVVMSGLEDGPPAQLNGLGVRDILHKPYEPAELLQTVRRALSASVRPTPPSHP